MTKLGSFSSVEIEPKIPVYDSWREELLGSSRVSEDALDDLSDLREEDIWGVDDPCGEEHIDLAVQKSREEVRDVPDKESAFDTKTLRSLLSVEMDAAASIYPSDFSTFAHLGEGGQADAGWCDETGAFKSNKYILHLCDGTAEGGKFGLTTGVSLSAPLEASNWGRENVAEEEEDGEELVGEARLVPPHELVAREYAKSRALACSVFEGAGRTLKGMDQRRLRSAVWSRTGFMG